MTRQQIDTTSPAAVIHAMMQRLASLHAPRPNRLPPLSDVAAQPYQGPRWRFCGTRSAKGGRQGNLVLCTSHDAA